MGEPIHQPETQLDRIEQTVRQLRREMGEIKQALFRIGRRLDAICGHESTFGADDAR
jgi:hypothetical protein